MHPLRRGVIDDSFEIGPGGVISHVMYGSPIATALTMAQTLHFLKKKYKYKHRKTTRSR